MARGASRAPAQRRSPRPEEKVAIERSVLDSLGLPVAAVDRSLKLLAVNAAWGPFVRALGAPAHGATAEGQTEWLPEALAEDRDANRLRCVRCRREAAPVILLPWRRPTAMSQSG